MIRYLRQKQKSSCAPVAIVNALKFQRHPDARRGKLLLNKIKKQVKYMRDGTLAHDAHRLYRKLGFRKMYQPSWNKIHVAILKGNAILLDICFVAEIETAGCGGTCGKTITVGCHTFLLVGFVISDGECRFRAINLVNFQNSPVQHFHWFTPEEIMAEFTQFGDEHSAWLRNVFLVPGESNYGKRKRKKRNRRPR